MAELREDENLAVKLLKNAGYDPDVYKWQEQPDGTIQYKALGTAFRTAQGTTRVYPDKKRRRTLPLAEAKALAEFAPWLRYSCQRTTNLWCGGVTLRRPCLVNEVALRRTETLAAIRRFFERCQFNTELLFTIIHEEVCDSRNCERKVVINVHAHFLFTGKIEKSLRGEFQGVFQDEFPVGSRVEPVKHRGKFISYILRTPDLRPLMNAGEYVNWVLAVEGKRRMCAYGPFRDRLAKWKKQRKRVETRHVFHSKSKRTKERFYLVNRPPRRVREANRDALVIMPLDTVVGTTVIKGKDGFALASVVKNPSPMVSDRHPHHTYLLGGCG